MLFRSWQGLLPRLRGRDKEAYKLIKQRLDAVLAAQRNLAQANSDALALCARIEKHATRTHYALYAPTLESYLVLWKALPAEFDAATRQRGQQALDRCQAVMAAHERELARAAEERAADEARARELDAELLAQQQAAAERAAADAIAQAAADLAREAEVQADQQAQAREFTEKQAADARALADIASLIRLSGAALARGDTRKAARFRQSIEAALPEAPSLSPHLSRSLEQLDHRLNELRQWKDYAAAFVSQSHSFPHCHKCGNNSGALFFSSGLLATGKISSDANEGKPLPNHRNAAIHRLRVNPRPFIFDEKRDRKFALQSLL